MTHLPQKLPTLPLRLGELALVNIIGTGTAIWLPLSCSFPPPLANPALHLYSFSVAHYFLHDPRAIPEYTRPSPGTLQGYEVLC